VIAIGRDWRYPPPRPIFGDMAIFPPMFGPRAALTDLKAFLRQRSREQLIGAALAVLVTAIIVIIFFVDAKINTAPPQQIVYVESYGPERTDADIIRDQKKASEERRKAAEEKRRQFQELEKRFNIE
jgi:hypothetical protein